MKVYALVLGLKTEDSKHYYALPSGHFNTRRVFAARFDCKLSAQRFRAKRLDPEWKCRIVSWNVKLKESLVEMAKRLGELDVTVLATTSNEGPNTPKQIYITTCAKHEFEMVYGYRDLQEAVDGCAMAEKKSPYCGPHRVVTYERVDQ